tara:strand:- start:835 stop:1725 length:891 start_codon:yes stop_codon:yes gene_type:complete
MINFLKNGYEIKKSFFNPTQCSKLLKKVYQSRNFNKIWLSEHEYKNNKILKTVNPRPGRNLIEKLDTSFIFSNEKFITLLNQIMGNSWRVLDYKFVVALEKKMVPNWVSNLTKDTFIPNMGRFIKEKYRDITYFRGIDFHQDIIDFPHKQSDFATFYVYLDNVDKNSSPLILFPKSHIYGAKTFPHDIKKENNFYRYYNNSKTSIKIKPKSLIGKCGTMYFWHPCILHGTQPTFKDKFRISIRILIEKNHLKKKYLIDKLNSKIKGSLSVKNSRRDINKKTGKYIIKGNFINKNYK